MDKSQNGLLNIQNNTLLEIYRNGRHPQSNSLVPPIRQILNPPLPNFDKCKVLKQVHKQVTVFTFEFKIFIVLLQRMFSICANL